MAQAQGQKPAALDPGIQQYLDQISQLSGQLQQSPQLLTLDPQAQAALDAINARDQAALKQQFDQAQAQQIAKLYGNRVNQSSIATNALGQLLQQQGLVSAQQQADAAQREMTAREFLTQQQQAQRQLALQGLLGAASSQLEGFKASTGASQAQTNALLELLNQLSGQQTQRDIANGQIGLGDRQLNENARQANLNFQLNQQEADRRLAESRGIISKVLAGIQGAGQLASGIGSLAGTLGIGGH